MAKSKSFFGLRRGSTKSQTYQVLNGQQITKDRVYDVANPKTNRQMRQRALFANAVKFYKHSISAFFRFAYEDKKQNESDYNAFMRHNVTASLILNKTATDSKNFPAIGNEWMLTQGQLPNLDVRFITEYPEDVKTDYAVLVLSEGTAGKTTMGELSEAIIASYGLHSGDIFTLVYVSSRAEDIDDEEPGNPPTWEIKQFKLDPTSEATIVSVIGASAKIASHDGIGVCLEFGYNPDPLYAHGATAIVSRVTPNGTLVCDSYLRNDSVAQNIVNAANQQSYIDGALVTWGATGEAILQGGLLVQQ